MLLLLVEGKIEIRVAKLGEVKISAAGAGKIGLDVDSDVVGDVTGDDEPSTAQEEIVIRPDGPVALFAPVVVV